MKPKCNIILCKCHALFGYPITFYVDYGMKTYEFVESLNGMSRRYVRVSPPIHFNKIGCFTIRNIPTSTKFRNQVK